MCCLCLLLPAVLHLQRRDDELSHDSGLLLRRSEVTPSLRHSAPPLGTFLPGAYSSGRKGDSIALPPRRVDSHGSGGPSSTAQITDPLAAPWLDLTVPRAGGLSSEVSLRFGFNPSGETAFLGWFSGPPPHPTPTTITAQFHAVADKATHGHTCDFWSSGLIIETFIRLAWLSPLLMNYSLTLNGLRFSPEIAQWNFWAHLS